jgi:hypothetical protein
MLLSGRLAGLAATFDSKAEPSAPTCVLHVAILKQQQQQQQPMHVFREVHCVKDLKP